MLTVVLDTQIILRGASSATPSITAKIYTAWDAGRFTLLLSEPILAEVEDVLGRPEVLRKLHIVSADAGLLSLREVQGIQIVDAPTFWQALTRETQR